MTTTVVETTRNVVITSSSGVPAVIISEESGPPTVVVSAVGAQGPAGAGVRVLGTQPANTTPDQFPTSPAPQPGDAWAVNGEQLWVYSGSGWVLVFEIPTDQVFVALVGNQIVDGTKTFLEPPRTEAAPVIDADLANKLYVDQRAPQLSLTAHQHAVGLYVLTPEESDETVPVGSIIIRRTV